MNSLISRTTVLIISRLLSQAVLLFSPVLLVRFLDVHNYGQYREFILYAMLFYHILGFALSSNLLYFLPQCSEKEDQYITHTAIFLLGSFLVGLILIVSGKGLLLSKTSYDFILPLIIYLFFTLNMSFWDGYWLGKKRPDYVLYYSVLHTLARVAAVLSVAYFTRNVLLVIYAIGAVEGIRFAFVLLFFFKRKSFTSKIDYGIMKEQLAYSIPLGIGNALFYLNTSLSTLFVSVTFGVEMLAVYTIGSYKIPILNLVRSSVVDSIFPDVVERTKTDPFRGLELWQKSNIIFCTVSFPVFTLLFYYADVFIVTLFTSGYAASVPIFRTVLLLMVIQAFEMTVPLRGINKTRYFISGSIIRLFVNFLLMIILARYMGMLGAALAMVVSGYVVNIYLARWILKLYKIKLAQLFMWRKVFKIALSALIGVPFLFLGELVDVNDIFRACMVSIIYISVFCATIRGFKIEEPCLIFDQIRQKLKKVIT